jgi:hypothetical protein
VGRQELAAHARPGAQRVLILLSDGNPTVGTAEGARAEAGALKAAGVSVFSIGLGTDADAGLLAALASAPNQYYFAPSAEDLGGIYRQVAANLPCR